MLRNCRWVVTLSLAGLALLPAQVRAQGRADIAQWDFEGNLESTTGQPPLLEQGVAEVEFETVDIKGAPAEVARFSRGTYFQVLHGFPSNNGIYVNQFTIIMDVMFPDRSPSGGWAGLLQTNCCNQNDGDWFVNPDGGLGVEGSFGGSIQDGEWYRIALAVDLVAGTYTSYLDGVQVQQVLRGATTADMAIDGRFSLYSPTDPDAENHFFIFADQDGQDSEGYVNSFQFRDSALSADEIANLGGPTAEGIKMPSLLVERHLPVIAAGATFTVNLDLFAFEPFSSAKVRERIPRFWVAADPSAPGRIEVDANGRQTIIWEISGGVQDQTLTYRLTAPNPFANVAFVGSSAEADGVKASIVADTQVKGGSDGFVAEGLVITIKQPTAGCAGADPGNAAQARDYLTDGDAIIEGTVAPALGESVSPDFLGASPSPGPVGPGSLTWTRLTGPFFQHSSTCDECMTYLAFYAENTTGATLKVSVGSASDDGEQILIDGREVWNHSIGRASGRAQTQDHSPLFDLPPGKHLVLQKVFEGCGDFDSAFRFEDEDQNPLVGPVPGGPISFSLDPAGSPAARSFVLRDVADSLDVGETGKVTLKLRVREAGNDATIEENVPAGFTISEVTGGGVQAGQKITWTLSGPLSSTDLSYRIAVPAGARDAAFSGTATLGGRSAPIVGDQTFLRGAMNAAGFIKHWLVLGPLDTLGVWTGDPNAPPADPDGPSAAPENGDLHLDFLTDGTTTEKNIRPFEGMRISPVFEGLTGDGIGSSKALGLEALTRACAPAVPTWERHVSPTGTFNHADYFGAPVTSQATYAGCYLTNTTGAALNAMVAIHSDDAFIALLDGNEIIVYEPDPCSATDCGRGYGAEDSIANTAPVSIPPGEHFLLTRVHQGFGGSGFRLRFQDQQGNPLLNDKLTVSLRSTAAPPPVRARRILSSETYRLEGEPLVVTLLMESTGRHDVAVREVLPAGFTASDVSHGGAQAGGQLTWNVTVDAGTTNLSYRLVAGDCPAGGTWCGNGPDASQYTVDGGKTHSLAGDTSFRRDTLGTEDLGSWDVRDVGYSGGATQRLGEFGVDVTGKGGGVKQTRDELRFISQPASGDFEISAKIECMQDLGGLGQGGLMVRDTFDTFSAHAYFHLTSAAPAGGGVGTLKGLFRRQTKTAQNSSAVPISDNEVLSLPIYLKLKRTGTLISFQRSSDGVTYAEVGTREIGTGTTQVNLRNETLVGLATSGGGGGSARVDYREARFPPLNPPFTPNLEVTFRRGDADASSAIDLSDAIKLLNYLFLGGPKPECLDAADFDDDGEADISDSIANLNYQFLGGFGPADPGSQNCGPDKKQEPDQGKPELGCDLGCR